MGRLSAGPVVIFGNFASVLLVNFFVYPAMLLTGQKAEEDIMRRTGLVCMCVTILFDLAWANAHPQPVPLAAAAAAAAAAAVVHAVHLLLAFGLLGLGGYSAGAAVVLQLATGLPWILVGQVGTAFIVSSSRSPARYQILAWITVMALGTLVTLLPWLREMRALVVAVASLPRAAVAAALLLAGSASASGGGKKGDESPAGTGAEGQESAPSVALPRALRFAVFACNGSTGEALNDMATDLKMRSALAAGDTTLTISYNVAVLLSMSLGYVSESLASGEGARRFFGVLWGLCQICRGVGMEYLTQDRTWLMFVFVFFDKFTGPLGQAAIDTALLALLRRGGGGSGPAGWPRLPATAMWTLRAAAERLERPLCQLLLLSLGAASAPQWIPTTLTALAVAFVVHTLRPGAAEGHAKAA